MQPVQGLPRLTFLPAQPSSASASKLSNLSSSLSSLALKMAGRSIASEPHEEGALPLGGPLENKRVKISHFGYYRSSLLY